MKDFYYLTEPNPDPTIVFPIIRVMAYLTPDFSDPSYPFLLNRIEVARGTPKHQGWGSKLLTEITNQADNEHVTLILGVSPDEEEWFSPLVAWYTRFGFVPSDKSHPVDRFYNVLIREPQPAIPPLLSP